MQETVSKRTVQSGGRGLPDVIMHFLFVVTFFMEKGVSGIAEDGKAERRYGIRKIKKLHESLFPFGDGVDAAPERSQFLGACREQQVFP